MRYGCKNSVQHELVVAVSVHDCEDVVLSGQAKLVAAAREKELRARMHRLQSVSGGGRPDEILQQLESQRDFKAALQTKLAKTENKKVSLEETYTALIKQRETLLEEVPDRGNGASARMSEEILWDELKRKKSQVECQAHGFVRIDLLLVEAKDAMRRVCCRLSGVPILRIRTQTTVSHISGRSIDERWSEPCRCFHRCTHYRQMKLRFQC
eukprot:COSAG05_NODE_3672_length_1915_cov_1.610132_1_plen_211_part_00